MEYIDVDELKKMSGLRIVLNPGLPGPWGEAAKNLCYVKGLSFAAGRLERGGENLPLKAWTAQTSAPTIIWNDERPRSTWNEQLFLLERLAPYPSVIPTKPEDRAILFGYANELCGENGLGWCRRLMMIHRILTNPNAPEAQRAFMVYGAKKYGYTPAAGEAAPSRVAAILRLFVTRLQAQHASGSQFFIGNQLSALDIYWASFAAVVGPLSPELCPMMPAFREGYSSFGPFVRAALSPILFEHRDFIYRTYLKLPMDFNDDTFPSASSESPKALLQGATELSEGARALPKKIGDKMADQKVAVVVGVGPGLGIALARRFARGGYAVGLLARKPEVIKSAQEEIEKAGGKAFAVSTDAGDPSSVAAAFKQIKEKLGAPEVLIYHAGMFQMGGILEVSPEKFLECFKINCMGGYLAAQQVLPDMVKAKRGTILFTGATASIRGSAKFAPTATGKFALRALSQSIAREFGSQGIHAAHVVIDGQIDTPYVRSLFPDRETHTFLSVAGLAETYWQLHVQDPTVWTLEIDVRPSTEKF